MHDQRLLVVFAVVAALLLVPLPLETLARQWFTLTNTIENAAHPLLFWWCTTQCLPVVRRRVATTWLAYSLTLALMAILGIGSEFLQSLVGRDSSWEDVGNDTIGAMLALALQARKDAKGGGRALLRPMATLAAVALIVAAAFPVAWTVSAYVRRWAVFPVIWSSNSVIERRLSFWKQDAYPGLVIDEPARDWRGYSALQVRIRALRSSGTSIRIRVHDQRHNRDILDRYDHAFVLADSSEHVLSIPLQAIQHGPAARELDMSAIRGLIIFQEDGWEPPRFSVGEIRLVR
jgi:VanZ family protein